MDFTNLRAFMDNMAFNRTPGNAVEVYFQGKPVFQYVSGYSDWENKTPLSGNELYNIYSCSKLTTVTAGMQCLERGMFLLSDPLYEYIPEFRDMFVKDSAGNIRKAAKPITLGDLFSMTAGFRYDFSTEGFQLAREKTQGHMDTVEVIKCIAVDPLDFDPGEHWQYSICHDVLAAVISVVSGKKFRDYVKDNIFIPLEMSRSVYHHSEATLQHTAQQYLFETNAQQHQDIVEAQKGGCSSDGYYKNVGKAVSHILGDEYDSGGAGIITSVADYAKLAAALANWGLGITGERILSKASVDCMRQNRLNATQLNDFDWPQLKGCGYGLGVRTHIDPSRSGLICNRGEFGWGGAAGASVIVDPDIGLGVFYAQHILNPREEYYQPRLRNIVYSCL